MKIIDFIVCDDIRQEVGGKVTLVGVYADRLMVQAPEEQDTTWPLRLKLGFFMRLYNEDQAIEADSFELEVLYNGDTVLQKIKGRMAVSPDKRLINIYFVNNRFSIPGEGDLDLRLVFRKEGRKVLEISPDVPFKINPPMEKHVVH
ncbi:MAG: hypothetical protein GY868_05500 [Deltaproteobacteria bacterium]|nr:hypothetical protein [Deltaproteobacteria bacterium]